jgi:adenosylcobinamide amidohydrolase
MPESIPSEAESSRAGAHILLETAGFSLDRRGRFLRARLKKPHLVLSTSHVNGGMGEGIGWLVNHQSSEGKGHMDRHDLLTAQGQAGYHATACAEAGTPPGATALMGTAADMQYAAVREESFGDARVWAVATAGVQGNAGRAGDPAKWDEAGGAWKPVHAVPGTINILLLFGSPLLPAALARAVATLTEAKTAALLDLAVPSRYSPHLATGTGTDQFCLASPIDASLPMRTWTGKHAKLGELLANAVIGAVKEALRWQNGLDPSRTRHLEHALGRFGVESARLRARAGELLTESGRALLESNFEGVVHQPQAAAAAYALASVQDRITHGTLPAGSGAEHLASQAALFAAGLAARPDAFAGFRAALLPYAGAGLPELVAQALALGWAAKWE